MSILVTKGELAILLGSLEYGRCRAKLKEAGALLMGHPSYPDGIPGLWIIEALDGAPSSSIDLSDAEISGLLDLLAGNGYISSAARQKVADYVASATPTEPTQSTRPEKYRWLLPIPDPAPEDLMVWAQSLFVRANLVPGGIAADGRLIMFASVDACSLPGAVMEG